MKHSKIVNKILVTTTACMLLYSCVSVKSTVIQTSHENKNVPIQNNVREYSEQSVLWQQNAGEYRALCYQAFSLARLRLDEQLKENTSKDKKLAIITDIDETVMDNSPYSAEMILDNFQYTSESWKKWVDQEDAQAVPGATDFLNYAKSKGVEIFYVSNRKTDEVEATLVNMKKINFPFADKEHCLFKSSTSDKQPRFEEVAKTHTILLFMGDNLSDFSTKFKTSTEDRNSLVKEMKDDFGKKFIVLPNPMYGDWESHGIYKGKHNWTENQMDSLRKANLKGF